MSPPISTDEKQGPAFRGSRLSRSAKPEPRDLEKTSLLRGYAHTQFSNTLHKFWVLRNMLFFCLNHYRCAADDRSLKLYLIVIYRGLRHDLSKYRWSEAKYFARTICRLKVAEYGSPEYQQMLADLQPCLCLHYSRNRHHPEHHQHGIEDMNRYDLIEMIADWGAATRRSANGDLKVSIQRNSERFGYDQQMVMLLTDEAELMGLV